VDFFIHDSLHTSRNMMRELRTITPYLSRPSLVISDDIEGNCAFGEWAEDVKPAFCAVLQEPSKISKLGVAAFTETRFEESDLRDQSLSNHR